MKLKDLVANSLPRVRGRKSKKSAHAHSIQTHSSGTQKSEFSTCPRYFPNHHQHQHHQQQYFQQYHRMGPDSRESSVERSSTVAVVDAPWRENAAYTGSGRSYTPRPGDTAQALTYYTAPPPPPQHGMVMSHSADAISSHATMAVLMTSSSSSQGYHNHHHHRQGSKVTSSRPGDLYGSCSSSSGTDYQHHISAISESAVNYIGPNCFYHTQHQHQHHHHHNHNHHYVYHHHHHRPPTNSQQPQYPSRPAPLTENNQQISEAHTAGPEKPKKSSGSAGFLRKSFASFRAMRKQGGRSKEQETRPSPSGDENDKCLVCPYPETQGGDKNSSDRKSSKQSRKGLKGLTKSKKKKTSSSAQLLDHHSDKSWYSDNDTHKVHPNFTYNMDVLPHPNFRQFPVRECSMQGSIPRHDNDARSRESSCIRDLEGQGQDTVSLSGYDSDAAKNRSGRSRSRIKTNPWLPSPQPSLSMGRRFVNGQPRDGAEDAMEEDMPSCFPRSASFDYHSQLGLTSTFQSPLTLDDSKRGIQRHRSLTPVDLKLNLSLPMTRSSYTQLGEQAASVKPRKDNSKVEPDKNILNDLNSNPSKSRPSSIVSPNAEFMTLADNIEQLANNISFEYEDVSPVPTDGGTTPIRDSNAIKEEKVTKKRRSESDNLSDNAHSPDSGIACLGSCDGDESLTLSTSAMLEASPTFETRSSTPGTAHNPNALLGTSDTFPRTSSPRRTTARKISRNSNKFATSPQSDRESNCQLSAHIAVSSSDESLNSGVISESDIDNTSYRYADTSPRAFVETDLSKPLNFPGSLMVEERLDVDFQSLPRRGNGNTGRKSGQKGVPRYHTLATVHSDRDHSLVTQGGKNKSKADHNTSMASNQGQDAGSRSISKVIDREGHRLMSDQGDDLLVSKINKQEHQLGLSVVDNGLHSNIALVVSLDGKRSMEALDESVKGQNNSHTTFRDGLEPPLGFRDAGKMEAALLSTPGGASADPATDMSSFETVDACVQTDFYDDFETWERRQPAHLPHLDESFDPVESTRRWLLSGNMQGSADTGYSSQARDSHVFMDDEAPGIHFENKGGVGNDWAGQDAVCLETNPSTSRQSTANVTSCHLVPGTMSPTVPIKTDKVKVRTKPTGSSSDETKRHSSDSSTSTLTSDLQAAQESGLNSLDLEEAPPMFHHQRAHNSSATKNNDDEPDYVNLPSHSHNISCLKESSAQTAENYSKLLKFPNGGKTETQRKCKKCYSPHPYILPLDAQDPRVSTTNDAISEGKVIDTSLGSIQRVDSMSLIDPDTADYLEFLRDAPLSSDRSKTPVFIIPGFGPIELTFELSESCLDFMKPRDKCSVGQYRASGAVDSQTLGNPEVVTKRSRKSSHRHQDQSTGETLVLPSHCRSKIQTAASKSKMGLLTSSSHSLSHDHAEQLLEPCEDTKGHTCHHGHSGKRKTSTHSHGSKDFKTSRCPTMRSYDVDGFSLTSSDNLSPAPSNTSHSGVNAVISVADASFKDTSSSSARNLLAERVAHLRREKEIIYRKIQEIQDQELSRQREQLQHQRHLHSQRKEELLETLQDLKEKLEEQNRKLQLKCAEESKN